MTKGEQNQIDLARMERVEKLGMMRYVLIASGVIAFFFAIIEYTFSIVKDPWYIELPADFISGLVFGVIMWVGTKWYRKARKRIADSN